MDVITFNLMNRTDHHASIVDLSSSGVGIESNTFLEPGLVWFRDRIWGQQSGVLLWSRQVGSQYRSGIRFGPLPHDAELFAKNQFAEPGPREPFRDLHKVIAIQLQDIKRNPACGSETDRAVL